MQEKIKGFLNKAKEWWKAAAKKTKMILGGAILAVVIVIGVVVAANVNQPYSVLFTGLNQSELTEIITYLSDNGVTDYRVSGEDTIMVPKNQETQLKADLLLQGYPTSGFGYSTYFDHVGSLTTESERNTLYLYDLQDRIAAVIRCFDGVKDASVTIAPKEDNSYVLDRGNTIQASASVMVIMQEGRKLTENQVEAIRHHVSRSVQGLEIDNISITDSYGNSYSSTEGFSDIQDVSALKLQLEEQVNNTIRTNIFQVLSPLYGENNIRVSVNSIVDVDRRITESTDYSTEDWAADGSTNGEGIIGKKIYDQEVIRDADETAGGVAGTQTNADVNEYVENELNVNGNENVITSSGETNYLVDQENQQIEHVAGTVSDVMVSVSINGTVAGNINTDALYSHIARAAGIASDMQGDKISILVEPFYQEETSPIITTEKLPIWVLYAAIGGFILFLIILFIILMARHSRKRRLAEEQAMLNRAAPVPQEKQGADIMDLQLEKSLKLRKDVRKFAETSPEIAAQMLKNWLKEGEGKNE